MYKTERKFWFAIKHGSFREQEERPLEELSERELTNRIKVQEFYKKRFLEDKAKEAQRIFGTNVRNY